ncbi:MAG TPA: ABC transporter ATP-binding protein [Lachnospiraceae bacterium]|nr:ABC transporter ATP-binding protein [Lachnospiraceae bacterium]
MSLYVDIEKKLGSFYLRSRFECGNEITGILGPSGSGKSLTLKCIAGIERPDRGRIILDGRVLFDSEKRIDLKPRKRRVGYMFQNYALFPDMNVGRNILCGLHGERDRGVRDRVLREALKRYGLEGLSERRVQELSGGQQQRVALARIMVNRPQLLLLDEPFSALDAHLRMKLQISMLETLREYGRPVLMVSHSRDEIYRMCSKTSVLTDGLMNGPVETESLFSDPKTVTAALLTGCKNITPARPEGRDILFAPEWGIAFRTSLGIPEAVTHLGIRAHYFDPSEKENRFPVRFVSGLEEPFERVLEFRYPGQSPESPDVWWRIPKSGSLCEKPEFLGVSPRYVMPLRES